MTCRGPLVAWEDGRLTPSGFRALFRVDQGRRASQLKAARTKQSEEQVAAKLRALEKDKMASRSKRLRTSGMDSGRETLPPHPFAM